MTSFEFKLHPVSQVMAGPILWPLEKAREALRLYRDFMDKAPEDFNAFFAFLIVPPGPPFPKELHNKTVCGVVAMYTGPQAKADAVVAPLAQVRPAGTRLLRAMPFPVVQSMFDALVPEGLQNYWKADFVNELSDEVIEAHVTHGSGVPTFNSAMHIYPVSGAANRVGEGRHRVLLPRREVRARDRRHVPEPGRHREERRVGARLLVGAAPALGRRRLRQLPHGGGRGPHPGDLRGELRAAGGGQDASTTRRTCSA